MKKKYKILGVSVPIKFVKHKYMLEDLSGEYFPSEQRIEVDAGFEDPEMLRAIYHELGHAFQEISGLSQNLNDDAQEMVCQALVRLLIDNFEPKKK